MLIMCFLEDYFDRPWKLDDDGVQHTMLTAIIQYNAFHRCCWKANDRRWLSREEAAKAACCLDAFISCYVLLARWPLPEAPCAGYTEGFSKPNSTTNSKPGHVCHAGR